MRLGSGLDPRKLQDTIAQMRDMQDSPALICELAENPDAWIHLELSNSTWSVLFGYPLIIEPQAMLHQLAVEMPPDISLASWSKGIFACYQLPRETSDSSLAGFMEQIMVRLHKVADPASVEVALEMV